MFKKQELVIKERKTIKEKIKYILSGLLMITIITAALVFFTNTSGATIISIINKEDTFYYDWRDVLTLLSFPPLIYFDIFSLFLLFTPFTIRLAHLWYKMINLVWVYIIFAFALAIVLSLIISFFIIDDYDSCGQKEPLSGTHYVKDLKMCEQFEYHPETDKSDEVSILVAPADIKTK